MGGIQLRDGQRLIGETAGVAQIRPRVRTVAGDAIVLSNGNEVARLQIEVEDGAALVADNVTGAHLHDLIITRSRPSRMTRWDSLCHPVVTNAVFDTAASVVRGCNGLLQPRQKGAVVFMTDGRDGPTVVEHWIRRTIIKDAPTEIRDDLWDHGIGVQLAGDVTATVMLEDISVSGTENGISARASQRGRLTLRLKNTSVSDLLRDGVIVSTGFVCSGLPSVVWYARDCRNRQWVPKSDASVVVYADRYAYADLRRRGLRHDASAIEFYGYDQGSSEIEIHVQDSWLVGAAQPAVFNFGLYGHPSRQVIDLGCRNPAAGDPREIGEDRAACERAGYTSAGRNRIFGNAWGGEWSSDLSEVALVGPGMMMAQGNFWGDRSPPDGNGDALGVCSRIKLPDEQPFHLVSGARCELWEVPGRAPPVGIDGRFHLVADPAR